MKIHKHGFWENDTAEGHGHDEGLAKALVAFFLAEKKEKRTIRILDVGCGDGFYTHYFNTQPNWEIMCHGFDGNPNTQRIAKELYNEANCQTMDFSRRSLMAEDLKYDWVLSLEVGEHIPAEYEQVFLENLDRHNKHGIVLSWAIPGQGGDGHINCLDNWEVIEKIEPMGYILDMESTLKLRLSASEYPTPCYWFRDTLMVFRRK